MKIIEVSGKVFSDQMGRFPVTLSKGNQYIMVMYNTDSNAILAEPIKIGCNRKLSGHNLTFTITLPIEDSNQKLQILDNKFPEALEKHFREKKHLPSGTPALVPH